MCKLSKFTVRASPRLRVGVQTAEPSVEVCRVSFSLQRVRHAIEAEKKTRARNKKKKKERKEKEKRDVSLPPRARERAATLRSPI